MRIATDNLWQSVYVLWKHAMLSNLQCCPKLLLIAFNLSHSGGAFNDSDSGAFDIVCSVKDPGLCCHL